MNDPAQREASVPIAVQFLRRACLALDQDAGTARHEIRRALDLLLDFVVRTPMNQPVHGLAPWQARRVVDHVLAHLEAPIRVEDLATVTRLSASHFSRAFKLSFRMSPHAYIVALRLSRARALLSDSNEQLSQIAVACGFADQSHFSRVFRRRVGCAPGLWRRERLSHPIHDPAASAEDPAGAEALPHRRFEFLHLAVADDVTA
ncbi:helix-turn-helix transcriptional regulator [Rhodanobacter ginsengiterrae]|uniref:helix-turn-helix transcriptional regulator n=1 Tax=Rhodanobacter ginsengiterrae TaxID=2008451 RepID=UPI003CF7323B